VGPLELLYDFFVSDRRTEQSSEANEESFVDERGVTLSRAGVDGAGRRLAEMRSRHTPDYFAEMRERLGISPRVA
jgi:hypothetical protein